MPGRTCSPWPTAWAATPAVTSRAPSSIGALVDLDGEALGGDDASRPCSAALTAANAEIAVTGSSTRPEPARAWAPPLIAILRAGNKLVLAHIGDSRAFLAARRQAHPDHQGPLVRAEPRRRGPDHRGRGDSHPQRSLVTRVLTGSDDDEPDLIGARGPASATATSSAPTGCTDYVARRHHRRRSSGRARPPGRPPTGWSSWPCGPARPTTSPSSSATSSTSTTVDRAADPAPGGRRRSARARKGTRADPVDPGRQGRRADARGHRSRADDDGASPSPRRARARARGAGCAVAAGRPGRSLVVVGGGAYAAYAWSQRQYYVGGRRRATSPSSGASRRTSARSRCPTWSTVRRSRRRTCPTSTGTSVEDSVSTDTLADAQALVEQPARRGRCGVPAQGRRR